MDHVPRLYLLGNIALESDLPLPELPPAPPELLSQSLSIRVGAVPFELPSAVAIDAGCHATSSEYLLHVEGIARFYAAHGRCVIVEPEPNAMPRDVRAYLLGTIFAIVCHQRGLLPLHGSAVSHEGEATAFLGRSGDGKSSIAAGLALRGMTVIADDICVVDVSGAPLIAPAAAGLKLWRNSLDYLGHSAEGLDQVFSDEDKFRLPLPSIPHGSKGEALPLRRVVILERALDPHAAPALTAVPALRAIPLLMNLTHQSYVMEAIGARGESFVRCSQVAGHAQVLALQRPWDLGRMDETLDLLVPTLTGSCAVSKGSSSAP